MMAGLLAVVCLITYWPQKNAGFVLDDFYTVVRDPLIKNPSLYHNIWTSRLFDAHRSSGYIRFGYYRPVLQSSWILDYRLFGLKAPGYQWLDLLIHALNCFFIYILLWQLFGSGPLAIKASLFFAVLPTQEWVVRYVTGRGDELSAMFGLMALLSLLWVLKTGKQKGYFFVLLCWAISALTREVAISYILYAFLIYYSFPLREEGKGGGINRFCFYWFLIGALPFLVLWTNIPKQGNILVFHVLYFASIGLCLWLAQFRSRWFIVLFALFFSVSFYQGRFWTTEETLLRHTRSLELWPRTVVAQQLMMKYDDNIPAIKDMVSHSPDPHLKAMWLRRLGVVYFGLKDMSKAQEYLEEALSENPVDVDTLDALAVVYHQQGEEELSLKILDRSLEIDPSYPDTLRTLGIHYFLQKDLSKAKIFLNRCLYFEPENTQALELLRLANNTN